MQAKRRGVLPSVSAIVGAVLAFLILAAGSAFAGVGGSIAPTFPAGPVNVGDTMTGLNVQITNDSTSPNDTDYINVASILVTPSCGSLGAVCPAPSIDLNVFSISATGTGAALSSCEGVTFNIAVSNATTGELSLTPANNTTLTANITNSATTIPVASATGFVSNAVISYLIQVGTEVMRVTGGQGTTSWTVLRGQNGTTAAAHSSGDPVINLVTLGPANGSGGPFICEVDFTGTVLRVPTIDANGALAGKQTNELARATFLDLFTQPPQSASGSNQTTVVGPILSVAKTPDGATISQGGTATFTIVVSNTGDGDANGVSLTDALPPGGGVTWTLVQGAPQCSITGAVGSQTLNCNGTIAAGATFTAVVSAVTSAQACTVMNNTVTVTATNVSQPATDTGSITCVPQPVLSVVKTPDNQTITAGTAATFTIVVTNNGPGSATGVTLTDPLPAGGGVTWSLVSGAGCTITGAVGSQTLNCPIGTLAAAGTFTAVVSAPTTAQACAVMNNTATATSTNATQAQDSGSISCGTPLLSIAKTPDGGTISAGTAATFTIVVTNNGPGSATGVAVTDSLPAGGGVTWSLVSGTGCTVTGAVGAQTLNCAVGTMTQGSTFTAVVSAPTSPSACAAMNNTATVTATNAAQASDSGSITCSTPVLTMAKTPDGGSILPGATATFTIVLTNNGPGAATGVAITDPLPAGGGVSWSLVSGTGCSVTGTVGAQSLSCAVGTLAQGSAFTAVVSALTSAQACTAMNNTATATATNAATVQDSGSITCAAPPPPPPPNIPTLSEIGMILLMSLLGLSAVVMLRRRGM